MDLTLVDAYYSGISIMPAISAQIVAPVQTINVLICNSADQTICNRYLVV